MGQTVKAMWDNLLSMLVCMFDIATGPHGINRSSWYQQALMKIAKGLHQMLDARPVKLCAGLTKLPQHHCSAIELHTCAQELASKPHTNGRA